jgi:hypothetical protein
MSSTPFNPHLTTVSWIILCLDLFRFLKKNKELTTMMTHFILNSSLLLLLLVNPTTVQAIGHNGRIDMLHTVNHKEEIESLLKKRYKVGDTTAAQKGDVVSVTKKDVNSEDEKEQVHSRKSLVMAAKNGTLLPLMWALEKGM